MQEMGSPNLDVNYNSRTRGKVVAECLMNGVGVCVCVCECLAEEP